MFDHDEIGRVSCTHRTTLKSESDVTPFRDGFRVFWQPSRRTESASGQAGRAADVASATTTEVGVGKPLDGSLSPRDLIPLPKRGGGDLEVTICVQDVVSTKTRRHQPRHQSA